ncbi:MAG: Fic family protein [Planctomycetota bacterium]|nr:Fic family protein [Planctomycetota bacterium]
MKYPTYELLLELHTYLMHDAWQEEYYGPHRPELLESALARPRQAAAYAEADAISQSAYLFHGLLMNHGFVQGDKRTAYATLEWFLHTNHIAKITASDEAVVAFCLNAENEKWSVEQVDAWLRSNAATVNK